MNTGNTSGSRKKALVVGVILVALLVGGGCFARQNLQSYSESSSKKTLAETYQLNSNDKQYCCKYCTKGCACGDACISCDKTCHVGPGCACDSH